MKIPKSITAGDSISWDDDPTVDNLGNTIDSESWTLKYDFRQANVANLTVTASTQGSGWRTSLTKAQSANYAAGRLYYQAYVVNGDESQRKTLGDGYITIKQNLAAAGSNAEFRSQARQDLEAVQAAIRALVSGGAKSYSIGSRSFTKIDLPDLITRESLLKQEVVAEEKAQKIANGEGNPHKLLIRFK